MHPINSVNQQPDKQVENRDEQGRFTPGISGNPNGRSKGSVFIRAKLRQKLEEIPKGEKETYLELIVNQILTKALRGDFQTLKLVWEQIDGHPKGLIELDNNGCPIPIYGGLSCFDERAKVEQESENIRKLIEAVKIDKNPINV